MMRNRSIPETVVIPELGYRDVNEAAAWLCRAFGFRERLRIGKHRIQVLVDGGGAVVATESPGRPDFGHSMLVRVKDVAAIYAQALAQGGTTIGKPEDHPYGERQCTVLDPGGHCWTFSQTLADVDPREWGGELVAEA
ncbi:MAG: VOC family protein [Nevskia sp.]|nr:VOC family protein [Nevskia sp.]